MNYDATICTFVGYCSHFRQSWGDRCNPSSACIKGVTIPIQVGHCLRKGPGTGGIRTVCHQIRAAGQYLAPGMPTYSELMGGPWCRIHCTRTPSPPNRETNLCMVSNEVVIQSVKKLQDIAKGCFCCVPNSFDGGLFVGKKTTRNITILFRTASQRPLEVPQDTNCPQVFIQSFI